MSINTIHEELMANLESAVDIGKIMQVFGTLIGVIRKQQDTIDRLSVRSSKLEKITSALAAANKDPSVLSGDSSSPAEQNLDENNNIVETDVNGTLLELRDLGEDSSNHSIDKSFPDNFSVSASKSGLQFEPGTPKKFIASAPSIDEAEETDDQSAFGGSKPGSVPSSALTSKRPSLKNDRHDTTEMDDVDVDDEDADLGEEGVEVENKEEDSATGEGNKQTKPQRKTPTPPGDGTGEDDENRDQEDDQAEQEDYEDVEMEMESTTNADAKVEEKENEEGEFNVSTQKAPPLSGRTAKGSRSPSPHTVDRRTPSPHSTDNSNDSSTGNNKNNSNNNNSNSSNKGPGGESDVAARTPHVATGLRKTAPPAKRSTKVSSSKNTSSKGSSSTVQPTGVAQDLSHLLPPNFLDYYDRMVHFFEQIDSKGGVEEIVALPTADRIVCYDDQGTLPKQLIDTITARIRPTLLQELSGLKSQVQTLKDEAITHAEFAEIMQGEAQASAAAASGAGAAQTARRGSQANATAEHTKEKELARKRLISMIRDCIEEEIHAADAELLHRATVGSVLTGSTPLTSPSSSSTTTHTKAHRLSRAQPTVVVQESANSADKEYVDEQLAALQAQLAALQLSLDTAQDAHKESLAVVDLKVEALEQANRQALERDAEAREARRKDGEALKIMQRRLANVSIDNVMDELKVLQLQVNDRPSTTDVSNMMEEISFTFKKHLGENVVGLRGLVDQVYKQIHHKVNREDIKKLISAKLAQMEQDILRREEEMFNAASSTRCMSCGQLPADPTNAFVNHTAARRSAGPSPSTISGASTAVHPSSARDRHHHNNSARGGQQGQTHVAGGGAGGGAGGSGNQHSRNIQIPSGTAGFLRGVAASTVRPKTSPNAELSAQFRSQFSISNPSLQSLEPPQRDASVGDFDSSSQANIASFTAPDGVPRGGVSDGVTGGPLDDELSLHSEHSHNNMFLLPQEGSQTSGSSLLHSSNNGGGYGGGDPSQVLGPVRSEEIYQVITGSAGLKALMPQHTPMVPVRDPYGITAAHQQQHQTAGQGQGQGQGQSKRRQQQQVKVPEPMYRKAKLAAHLKEMVKVSAPSAQNYGYNSNNPFFVVEGYSEEGDPHQQNLSSSLDGGSSLHSSSRQGGKGARPRTQGSNPATSVYVPIPRSSGQPHSVTQQLLLSASTSALGNGEHTGVGTILPYITTSNSNKIPQQQEADFVLKANTSKLNSYV